MRKSLLLIVALFTVAVFTVQAQIGIPYTFSAGTVIDPDQMNANFSTVGNSALNRTGGTITGTLNSMGGSLTGTWTGSPTFSGSPVFTGSPSVTGSIVFDSDALGLRDTDGSHALFLVAGSNLSMNRTLTFVTGDANVTFDQSVGTDASPTFIVVTASGYREGYRATSTSIVATVNDSFILCNATTGPVTITLPPTSVAGLGRLYNVKKSDPSTNACIIDGDSAEPIDGAATAPFTTPMTSLTVIAGAGAWFIK
jgi:hypothetical protein